MSLPSLRTTLITSALLLACIAPLNAQAQSQGENMNYQLTVYGWFPAVGGTTSFASGTESHFNVSADNIIDSLNFAFMGTFGVKKGAWGLWTDLMYSDIASSKNETRDFTVGHEARPASASANLSLDVKTWVWSLAGTYELDKSKSHTTDFLFGTRLLDVSQTLDWTLNGEIDGIGGAGRTGTTEVATSLWDGILGIKGVLYLGDERKWFIPYYLDVGTGQSDLTWQIDTGIGYQYDWGALVATWRYLDYDMKSGEPIKSLDFNGLLLGATFQWQ